jgi:hypothetical protein
MHRHIPLIWDRYTRESITGVQIRASFTCLGSPYPARTMDLSRRSSRQSSAASTVLPSCSLNPQTWRLSNLLSPFRASSSSLPAYEAVGTSTPHPGQHSPPSEVVSFGGIPQPRARHAKERPLWNPSTANAINGGLASGLTRGSQGVHPPSYPVDKRRPLRSRVHERLLLSPGVYDGILNGLETREALQAATQLLFPTEKRRLQGSEEREPVVIPSPDPLASSDEPCFNASLVSSTGHQWATLHLDNHLAPGCNRPMYVAGSRICGHLKLDFPKKKFIRFIELVVSCALIFLIKLLKRWIVEREYYEREWDRGTWRFRLQGHFSLPSIRTVGTGHGRR